MGGEVKLVHCYGKKIQGDLRTALSVTSCILLSFLVVCLLLNDVITFCSILKTIPSFSFWSVEHDVRLTLSLFQLGCFWWSVENDLTCQRNVLLFLKTS